MNLQVKLFAAARDAVGRATVEITLPAEATVADLRVRLAADLPPLKSLQQSLLVAVNNSFAVDEQQLHETDEVACFPPVSGG